MSYSLRESPWNLFAKVICKMQRNVRKMDDNNSVPESIDYEVKQPAIHKKTELSEIQHLKETFPRGNTFRQRLFGRRNANEAAAEEAKSSKEPSEQDERVSTEQDKYEKSLSNNKLSLKKDESLEVEIPTKYVSNDNESQEIETLETGFVKTQKKQPEENEFIPKEYFPKTQQIQLFQEKPKDKTEEVPEDDTCVLSVEDILEMDGYFRLPYKHVVLVLRILENDIEVFEYSLQKSFNSWSTRLKLLVWSMLFLDPAVFVKSQKKKYKLQDLKDRNATKRVIPQTHRNSQAKILQNIQERLDEPDGLYSLQSNNCEHLINSCVFGTQTCHQLDRFINYLYILDIIYTFFIVGQSALASYLCDCVTNSPNSCILMNILLQLVHALYQSYKFIHLKQLMKNCNYIWSKSSLSILLMWLNLWPSTSSIFKCCMSVGVGHMTCILTRNFYFK